MILSSSLPFNQQPCVTIDIRFKVDMGLKPAGEIMHQKTKRQARLEWFLDGQHRLCTYITPSDQGQDTPRLAASDTVDQKTQ